VLLRKANSVVLVCERDDSSLAAARFAAERVRQLGIANDAVHIAVVNRSPSLENASKEKIEEVTGLRVLGIVPPAPDICVAAQRAGTPLSVFRPRSAPAGVLGAIVQGALAAVPRQPQLSGETAAISA
jgi:Flp pilus assembly CpaE family ATPase